MIKFILLFALPILLTLYFKAQNSKQANNLPPPPGPPPLPIIGNLHQFADRSPHTYLRRLSEKYGPIISLKLGSRRLVVVSSAAVVKEIMKSNDVVFSSLPSLACMRKLSYGGLDVAFSPYNDVWREMRKISTVHIFSTKQLVESFTPIFKDEVSKMMKKIAMDASSSSITNLSETMMSLSSNTICRVAFGKSYGDEGYGKNRFFDLLRELQLLLGGFFVEDYFPSLRWIDGLSGMAARLEKNFRDFDSFYEELIEDHLNPNRPSSMDGDIIDILLGVQRNGLPSSHLKFGSIKGLLMDIVVGGSDTVAAALVWALTSLMKNPSSLSKAQAEVRQMAGGKDLIDERDIEKLPYLRAIVKETLRLYPPAPLSIPRETISKCSINGYEIEAGAMVHMNLWAIGRDPATWENADEFVPERFLESEIDVRGRYPEVIPFGIGRRKCPAIGIGIFEVELALANVLYKFEWKFGDGRKEEEIDLESLPGITVQNFIYTVSCCIVSVQNFYFLNY